MIFKEREDRKGVRKEDDHKYFISVERETYFAENFFRRYTKSVLFLTIMLFKYLIK